MPPIEVTQVNSKAEQHAFIKFPWGIYANDLAWVPPLLLERKEFLDRRKHPFYKHGDAALFLARTGGEVVGRIMASDDPNYNALHQSNAGCFGLFESIDNQEVADALFAAATDWLHGKGRDEIMGPIDYSTNYVCGLLIDGFQYPPTLLTSHNPTYYRKLIEAWGFEKAMDLYAWWFSDPVEARDRLRRLTSRMKHRQSVSIRPANLRKIEEEARRIREIYNQAWQKNWGFVPFTEAEIERMTEELKPIVESDLILFAEIEGQPVGFILGVRDINVVLQKLNGRLTWFGLPIGLAKLLYYKGRIKKGRLIALGVIEKYRRHGIAEALVLRIIEEGMIKRGITGELSLTLEDNFMINRFLQAIGAEKYKTYRIYRRALSQSELRGATGRTAAAATRG